MIKIALAGQKGGIGKTTAAVNLAAALVRDHGHRVLLVDLDAQGAATLFFTGLEEVEFSIRDVVRRDGVPLSKAVIATRIEGLDLLPSRLDLAKLDGDLAPMSRREDRVARALRPAAELYDFAILDLPPALSYVTVGALVAADCFVAPVTPSTLAINGLSLLLEWTEDYRADEVVTAPLLGVLRTMADPRTKIGREVEGTLANSGLPIFPTTIPKRVAAEAQVGAQLVVGDPGASQDLADAYSALTRDVLKRIEELS